MYRFETGLAYQFNACVPGGKCDNFLAVAADRQDSGVDFIIPRDILSGRVCVLEGREFVRVSVDGRDYCASAVSPLDVSASFRLINQIRRTPGVRI